MLHLASLPARAVAKAADLVIVGSRIALRSVGALMAEVAKQVRACTSGMQGG